MTQSVIEGKNQKTNMSVCDIPHSNRELGETISNLKKKLPNLCLGCAC